MNLPIKSSRINLPIRIRSQVPDFVRAVCSRGELPNLCKRAKICFWFLQVQFLQWIYRGVVIVLSTQTWTLYPYRDPVDKLRDELQSLRTQLQQDANARGMQTQMYDDLRRRHDDLEREMARRGAEQQMANMYDNLQKKYDSLANEISRSRDKSKSPSPYDDLRQRIDGLARDLGDLKRKEHDRPPPPSVASPPPPSPAPAPPPSLAQPPDSFLMQFLCPFCGGAGTHSHGSYYYPGYSGPTQGTPEATKGTVRPPSPRPRRHTETQTPFVPQVTNTFVHHPATPMAASTPYAPHYHE